MNNNFEFKDWSGFRPLSGSYISQSEEAALRYKLIKGFRPLSGSYISQLGHLFIGAEMGGGFRPLSGSYISQSSSVYSEKAAQPVSVPYRGATFLNAFITHIAIMMMVSVPYRGATFLNCGMNATIIYYNGFPSPIGELHFSIEFGIMDEWIRYVSVPYRGATFLNLHVRDIQLNRSSVSVPYRGATFLNKVP